MSDKPKVVHLKRDPYDVLIDRRSPWGNPFVVGKDGDRAAVVHKHRLWINHPDQEMFRTRVRKELRGKALGCWCAPLRCHGDVLLEIANSEIAP